jgi:hypothetical protein
MSKIISLIFTMACLIISCTKASNLPHANTNNIIDDIILPMTYRNGTNPIIEINLNGKGPFKFIFDTGSPGLLKLDESLFTALNLNQTDSILAGDGSGINDSWHKVTNVASLSIGGMTLYNVSAMVRNYNRRANMDKVDGIIGLDFFKGKTVELDFAKNTFTISAKRLNENDMFVIKTPIERGIPTANLLIGTKAINAVFDTGNTGNLTLHEDDITNTMIVGTPLVVGRAQTVNNVFEIKQAQLKDAIQIAGHSLNYSLININGLLPKANMGIKFIKQFKVSFDIEQALCRLEKIVVNQKQSNDFSPISTNEYVGQYGDRTITLGEDNHLYIQRPGGMILKMIEKQKDTYGLEIVADALLVFERNANSKVVAIKVKRGENWERAEKS